MKLHPLPLAIAALALGATLAIAEPGLLVRYSNGVPRITLAGDFAGAAYTVYRAPARGGGFEAISGDRVLCLGSCYAEDRSAVPGESYLYRFDLVVPEGEAVRFVSYGPFVATISPALARPIGVFAFPNPGRGETTVQLHVAGSSADRPAQGEAAIYDLTGRRLRVIHRGAVERGLMTLRWDGRDDRGDPLRGGIYLLRFVADGQQAVARIVRH